MRRQAYSQAVALVFLVTMMFPGTALANWGWIEQMSGPGPFKGVQFNLERVGCLVTQKVQEGGQEKEETTWVWSLVPPARRVIGRPADPDKTRAAIECLTDSSNAKHVSKLKAFFTVEVVKAWSSRNDLAPEPESINYRVRLFGIRPVLYWRAHEDVDLGVGVGLTRFTGAGENAVEFGLTRWSIPLRARITPAPWFGKSGRLRAFWFEFQADYFPTGLTARDFESSKSWSVGHEFLKAGFIGIDYGRLFHR